MGRAAHKSAGFLASTVGGGLLGVLIVYVVGGPCVTSALPPEYAPTCVGPYAQEKFLQVWGAISVVFGSYVAWAIESEPGFEAD